MAVKRASRVSEEVREVLASLIGEVKDPEVGFVTITDVAVSDDLRQAKVYVSVYGDAANTVYVPAYTRYDAMASYKLTKNVDLQLNVQNLTDKTYYDKAYAAHFANQAAGRTALLTTSFHF